MRGCWGRGDGQRYAERGWMRTFRYGCPCCSNPFAVEEEALGRTVVCPLCNETVQIPAADSGSADDLLRVIAGQDSRGPMEMPPETNTVSTEDAIVEPVHHVSQVVPSGTSPKGARKDFVLPDPMAPVSPDRVEPPLAATDDLTDVSGAEVLVEDRPKTIVYQGKVIELRRVSPEEKQRRRWRRRIVLMLIGGVVLIYYLLLKVGKI